ncbi:arrestin domain-containing protein 3-like [Diorhabda carinulata]|uniref:arrestin domain-containing protein 3-like n=1 Tax=Diorhabda sublineata TaxID=1163346 RepID=UPI0024E14627|nr:arrestin domain-containing protein 3-like [Diorhabda sublineata]XP_057662248.1 arrestin domain-containing protein 3-like [Diorhabda carinulata]
MSCKILLDTPGIMSPGSTMYGRVVCTFISNLNIREIRCKLKGTEDTRIRRGKNTYIGENEFLNLKLRLLGESNLQSGVYEYPFYFPLPQDIPSSFQGEFGSISYSIKAVVDIPFSFDYKDKLTFVVTALTDFNKIRQNIRLTPITYQNEKNLCCWCCASEPITINLSLKKNAFVLGELAKVTVEVTNLSNKNVEELVLTLIRLTYYQSEADGMIYTKTQELLGFQTATGVGAHGQRTYLLNFQMPHSILLYNLASCQLIRQFFTLRAEAVLPIWHKSLTVETDIKLGHIPLREDESVETTTLGVIENVDMSSVPPRYSALF